MPTLKLYYSVEVEVEVKIEDFALTQEEIEDRAAEVAYSYKPENCVNWDWEWRRDPKPKPRSNEPPEECWISMGGKTFATNKAVVLFKDCPIRPAFDREELRVFFPWITASSPWFDMKAIEEILFKDFRLMPQHNGFFDRDLLGPFLELEGVSVVGHGKHSAGYVVQENRLLAIVMPIMVRGGSPAPVHAICLQSEVEEKAS